MTTLGNPLLLTPEGYQISRSVRLRSSASAYFNRTPASAGNRQKFTISAWVKRGKLATSSPIMGAGASGSTEDRFMFAGNDTFLFDGYSSGSTVFYMNTTAVYRDPSAWYHFVCEVDTTQATSSNRIKLYVNGVQVTAFATATYPSQNANLNFNNNVAQYIGYTPDPYYADQYFTEINFIDGQALDASSFGETDAVTGVWKPKKYAGTYGTNGFYLNFSDPSAATAAAIGKDYSGNGNNWTPNNISVTAGATYDSMIDVPTPYADGGNGRGNYAVLNPLNANRPTILDGNIRVAGGDRFALSTIGMTSGQWYAEMTVTTVGTETSCGIAKTDNSSSGNNYVGSTSDSYGYYAGNGNKYNNGSSSAYGATYTSGDVIGIAFDADAGTLVFYKNNTSQGTAYTGLTSGPYYFAVEGRSTGTANNVAINFGQRPFAYTPPTGFKALNTQNLPEPTIKKGGEYFNTVLYTGNATARSITGVGFQPDFVWTKSRSGAESHRLYDAVRGATQSLYSNLTNAEATEAQSLTAFGSDGFSLGTGAPNSNAVTYAAWNWKESATAGFDIVTYTGDGTSARAISHSLGVAPKMVIIKARSIGTENWNCWHTSLNNTAARILLNTTGAVDTGSPTVWGTGGINPTSTTFQVGSAAAANGNGTTYVAYCFAEVPGFSKFGSYTGNGSTDGAFVFCGFRPAFVMIKRSDSTSSWAMFDDKRSPYNVAEIYLRANDSAAEETGVSNIVDLTSNGFKLRLNSTGFNDSGGTYIYMAFAENPTKYALAR